MRSVLFLSLEIHTYVARQPNGASAWALMNTSSAGGQDAESVLAGLVQEALKEDESSVDPLKRHQLGGAVIGPDGEQLQRFGGVSEETASTLYMMLEDAAHLLGPAESRGFKHMTGGAPQVVAHC